MHEGDREMRNTHRFLVGNLKGCDHSNYLMNRWEDNIKTDF
jgi:hypothetical protein